MKFNRQLAAAIALCSAAQFAGASIVNPGFESGRDGWSERGETAISSVSYAGKRSGKIADEGGTFYQTVSVNADSLYELSAYVRGAGEIAASIDGVTVASASADSGKKWQSVTLEFDADGASEVEISVSADGDDARFDKLALTALGDTPDEPIESCNFGDALVFIDADDHGENDGNAASNAIDGNRITRWSSEGQGAVLELDFGSPVLVNQVGLAWYKGNSRQAYFDIEASNDKNNWTEILSGGSSNGESTGLKFHSVTPTNARYVRLIGWGNSQNEWNSLLEAGAKGCEQPVPGYDLPDTIASPAPTPVVTPTETPAPIATSTPTPVVSPTATPAPAGDYGLDASAAPSENFDLQDWYLSIPVDTDGDGKPDDVKEEALNKSYQNSEYFYTGSDGGLVFKCPVEGPVTSSSTKYIRTELREMLRRGDTSVSTSGVTANNWVLSSSPSDDVEEAGGVDGTLRATLKVEHVTTTGSSTQVGRVIVGQIHANDNEPIRLYYRQLPGHKKGSVYFAHETSGINASKTEDYYELIGSRDSDADEPSDGIALGEVFSYEIDVSGNSLRVTLSREGHSDVVKVVDMSDSGYDLGGQYLYFKAGLYNQNNSGDADDYVQATFYKIENSHSGYAFSE